MNTCIQHLPFQTFSIILTPFNLLTLQATILLRISQDLGLSQYMAMDKMLFSLEEMEWVCRDLGVKTIFSGDYLKVPVRAVQPRGMTVMAPPGFGKHKGADLAVKVMFSAWTAFENGVV